MFDGRPRRELHHINKTMYKIKATQAHSISFFLTSSVFFVVMFVFCAWFVLYFCRFFLLPSSLFLSPCLSLKFLDWLPTHTRSRCASFPLAVPAPARHTRTPQIIS